MAVDAKKCCCLLPRGSGRRQIRRCATAPDWEPVIASREDQRKAEGAGGLVGGHDFVFVGWQILRNGQIDCGDVEASLKTMWCARGGIAGDVLAENGSQPFVSKTGAEQCERASQSPVTETAGLSQRGIAKEANLLREALLDWMGRPNRNRSQTSRLFSRRARVDEAST